MRELFRVENHPKVRRYIHNAKCNENSFSNSVLMVFGFLFQQGNIGSECVEFTMVKLSRSLVAYHQVMRGSHR